VPDSPIGSILAFGGDINSSWEDANGWMRCDGRSLDNADPEYAPLFDAIRFNWGGDHRSRFQIPDLRGLFLRGVDDHGIDDPSPTVRDPDRHDRTQIDDGGNAGNLVGSFQDWATGSPHNTFVTTADGGHEHELNFEITAKRDVNGQSNTVANPGRYPFPKSTESAGHHSHEVTGGDRETRPKNAYVHRIIRFK
jgi:hypothetical protein